ncbi:hypothetical protein PJF56_04825 [Roseofilum sp. BLCC_M91]|uniref:Uncharacterized protein n=1 Tax=Roseofilum halophilum BLCC-M91 TaxID=3022259 RepID=A0ABT7BG75_9CYAN|nr:hypothetical protein [Roseofilum halophilum]MDJ1178182.1 hypothetical protein [Roseofilum halophilum BLCC-M91]
MNNIFKTRTSPHSTSETWDGEYKSETPKWTEKLILQDSGADSDWEWGKVIPVWHNQKFETCNVN